MTDKEIKRAAKNFVKKTTLYGNDKQPYGSTPRSYYETELRCFIAGCEFMKSKLVPHDN